MKKPALPLKFWIIFHAGLVLALLLSLFVSRRPLSVDTDLLNLVPPSASAYNMAEAARLFFQKHNRDFVILSSDADFARARDNAEKLYRELEHSGALFDDLSLFFNESTILEYRAFLHEYRYALLDPQTAAMLETGDAQIVADEALARAYGAFTYTGLDYLDTDPFLLAERELRAFLESLLFTGGFSLRNDVLSAESEGLHYVVIRGRLSGEDASIDKGSGVREIFRAAEETAGSGSRRHFVFLGYPFHSHEGSNNAQREISLIGTITVLLFFLLFLFVFRSPLPAFGIIFASLVAIAAGLCAAFFVFRNVHILTFALGASLVGLSVDYSIHFFVQRREGLNGQKIRASIFEYVSLSCISSLICFLIFLFAPFGVLRQFALFCAAGLLSSCLTALCFFPGLIPAITWHAHLRNKSLWNNNPDEGEEGRRKAVSGNVKTAVLIGLVIVCLIMIFAGRSALKIKNDTRGFYTVPHNFLEREKASSLLLNYAAGTWFLVSGSSLQELLEREEYFIARLNEAGSGTFLGTSRFIPSLKTQEARYRSAANLLPLVNLQFEALRFSRPYSLAYRETYERLAGHYVTPSEVPAFVLRIMSNFFIGEGSGGQWYSAIMLLDSVSGGEHTASDTAETRRFLSLADEYEWVAAVNRAEDVSRELDRLTHTMLKFLVIAYAAIIAAMALYYRRRGTILKRAAVPLFAGLALLAVHACLGLSLSFFSVAGFVLVFCLGFTYMFSLGEDPLSRSAVLKDASQLPNAARPRNTSTGLAVTLSYVTTALSFGSLALSSFTPLRSLSLSVLSGLSAAFLWAMLTKDRRIRQPCCFAGPGDKGAR